MVFKHKEGQVNKDRVKLPRLGQTITVLTVMPSLFLVFFSFILLINMRMRAVQPCPNGFNDTLQFKSEHMSLAYFISHLNQLASLS